MGRRGETGFTGCERDRGLARGVDRPQHEKWKRGVELPMLLREDIANETAPAVLDALAHAEPVLDRSLARMKGRCSIGPSRHGVRAGAVSRSIQVRRSRTTSLRFVSSNMLCLPPT